MRRQHASNLSLSQSHGQAQLLLVEDCLYDNPAELALSEARRIWTSAKRFCLISVGTGQLKSVKVVDARQGATKDFDVASGSKSRRSKSPRVEERKSAGLAALCHIEEVCVQLAACAEPVHQRLLRDSHDPEKRFMYQCRPRYARHRVSGMESNGGHRSAHFKVHGGSGRGDKTKQMHSRINDFADRIRYVIIRFSAES